MTNSRYRLYREHKYVSFVLSSFSTELAKIDFSLDENLHRIKEKLAEIMALMHGHASHEDTSIHALLRKKGSLVHEKMEVDHRGHSQAFEKLNQLLTTILENTDAVQRIELGHRFYLEFQRFEAENMLHQIYEETVIMPELQRFYTDEELLEEIDAKTYALLTPQDMVEMMEVLFPHMNADDRAFFLKDIYKAEPNKFMEAWKGISSSIEAQERDQLHSLFAGYHSLAPGIS